MSEVGHTILEAIKWFQWSDIQDLDEKSENFGTFRAWYDVENDSYSYPYSEISGYALTTISYLKIFYNSPELIYKAKLAANWLFQRAKDGKHGGYHCKYIDGKFHPWLCSFDNGMILNGLVNLFHETGSDKYLNEAKELGEWLLNFMRKKDGTFYPKYDTNRNCYIDNEDRWSTQSGSFLAKNLIGLINLSQTINDDRYARSGIEMCELALKAQQSNGRFVTNIKENDTYMHPHCYTIEGLLAAWLYFDDERYLRGCYNGADWIKNAQMNNGAISRLYDSKRFTNNISIDSTSQSLRIWLLLSHYGDYDFPKRRAKRIANFLMKMQCKEMDKNAHGGFYYGITNNNIICHVSDHGTMFAIQTLKLYEEFINDSISFNIKYLI